MKSRRRGVSGSLLLVLLQDQREAVPPREEALKGHRSDAAIPIAWVDDVDFRGTEINQRDHVRLLIGSPSTEGDDGAAVFADRVTQDGRTARAAGLNAVIDTRLVENGFEIFLHGSCRVILGQIV